MKSKLLFPTIILASVLIAIQPADAQTQSLAGSWQLTLSSGPTVTEPAIHALATFTSDGSVIESDSSQATTISPSARIAGRTGTPGHGIWQPAPAIGNLFVQFISLIVNPNGTLYARKTVTIFGAMDASGDNFSGNYSYILTDPNGGQLGTGTGTVSGQRIPHPLLP